MGTLHALEPARLHTIGGKFSQRDAKRVARRIVGVEQDTIGLVPKLTTVVRFGKKRTPAPARQPAQKKAPMRSLLPDFDPLPEPAGP